MLLATVAADWTYPWITVFDGNEKNWMNHNCRNTGETLTEDVENHELYVVDAELLSSMGIYLAKQINFIFGLRCWTH